MSRLPCRAVVAVLSLLTLPVNALAQSKTHTFYAHVLDASGAPIEGLTAADFTITEAGKTKKVVRASFGGTPLRVLLVVDTSEAIGKILTPWRAAMQAFIDGVPEQDEIALVTIGRQLRIRVPPTTDRKKVKDEAGRVFSDGGSTVLLDGLVEANDRLLAKADDRAAVIVLLTAGGPENSTAVHEEEFNAFVQSIRQRGVVVHAVILSEAANANLGAPSASSGLQSVVAQNLTENTGGHLDSIGTATAVPDKLKAVAQMIALEQEKMIGWYQIDYTSDTAGPGGALDVTVSREGATFKLSAGPPK